MKIIQVATYILFVTGSFEEDLCKCPVLKQVDADLYAKIRGQLNMPMSEIPKFAPLDIDYGEDCSDVKIKCIYPRFTRHRSSVYYANGVNFSTVRRFNLADEYSIRCNPLTGVWLSDENSEITYIQCAYRPMLVNRIASATWEEFLRVWKMASNVLKTYFNFFKLVIGFD